jgi:Reverse transcriptase (RNA-dependent DNA polymerase)
MKDTYRQRKEKTFSAKDHCVMLLQSLYSLVCAANQWYIKIADIFTKLDFIASRSDPCFGLSRARKAKNLPHLWIIYVDDGAIMGTEEVIHEVLTALCKTFQVKNHGSMKHFVGCHVIEDKEDNTIYINPTSRKRVWIIICNYWKDPYYSSRSSQVCCYASGETWSVIDTRRTDEV